MIKKNKNRGFLGILLSVFIIATVSGCRFSQTTGDSVDDNTDSSQITEFTHSGPKNQSGKGSSSNLTQPTCNKSSIKSESMELLVEREKELYRDELRKEFPSAFEIGEFLELYCAWGNVLLFLSDSRSPSGKESYLIYYDYFRIADILRIHVISEVSPLNLKAIYILDYQAFKSAKDNANISAFLCNTFISPSLNILALLTSAKIELLSLSSPEKDETAFENIESMAIAANSRNDRMFMKASHCLLTTISSKKIYSKEWHQFWDANTKMLLCIVWDYIAVKLFNRLSNEPESKGICYTADRAIQALREYKLEEYLNICNELLILISS